MNNFARRCIYRVFCLLSLIVLIYLAIDFKVSGRLDIKMVLLCLMFFIVLFWGIIDWLKNEHMLQTQEKELKTYKMYIQPLEELVKEIRAKQHEFDNHMNAVLNMHIVIDNYEELVKQQSAYIKEVRLDDGRRYINLLKISDKILAGFIYSKIVNAPDNVHIKLSVENFQILSKVPEHDIIEIVGTLVDNAIEAMKQEGGEVEFILDSKQDKLIFATVNVVKGLSMEYVGHFFDKGYSTKGENRGLGLYNARQIAQKYNGEITVAVEERDISDQEESKYLRVQIEM